MRNGQRIEQRPVSNHGSGVTRTALLLCVIALSGCAPDAEKKERRPTPAVPAPTEPSTWSSKQRELYFGIPVQVRFQPADAALEHNIWAYLEKVDEVFNDYREDSETGRLNATLANGREAQVSGELAEALRFAGRAYHKTDGAFDVTIGPLRDLWREAARKETLPKAEAIKRARDRCGFDKVKLDGRTVRTAVRGMRFDFGGCINVLTSERWTPFAFGNAQHTIMAEVKSLEPRQLK